MVRILFGDNLPETLFQLQNLRAKVQHAGDKLRFEGKDVEAIVANEGKQGTYLRLSAHDPESFYGDTVTFSGHVTEGDNLLKDFKIARTGTGTEAVPSPTLQPKFGAELIQKVHKAFFGKSPPVKSQPEKRKLDQTV